MHLDKQSAVRMYQTLNPDETDVGTIMRGANEMCDGHSKFSNGEIAIVEFTDYLGKSATQRERDLITVFETLERCHLIMSIATIAPSDVKESDIVSVKFLISALVRLDLLRLFEYSKEKLAKIKVNLDEIKADNLQ